MWHDIKTNFVGNRQPSSQLALFRALTCRTHAETRCVRVWLVAFVVLAIKSIRYVVTSISHAMTVWDIAPADSW